MKFTSQIKDNGEIETTFEKVTGAQALSMCLAGIQHAVLEVKKNSNPGAIDILDNFLFDLKKITDKMSQALIDLKEEEKNG